MEGTDSNSRGTRRRPNIYEEDDANPYSSYENALYSDHHQNDQVNNLNAKHRRLNIAINTFIRLSSCFVIGVCFGILLEKSRVFVPYNIRHQMLLDRSVMLKVFLSAVASGLLILSFLVMMPLTRRKFEKASFAFSSGMRDKGVLAVSVGGLLLGCGMTLSGACPGMVMAQIGSGTRHAGITLGGAFVGTLVFGLLERVLGRVFWTDVSSSFSPLHEEFAAPYFIMSLPLVAMMAVIVFALEILVPWAADVKMPEVIPDNWFSRKAWPPYICGALIGLLQLPLVLIVEDTMGSSSSYCTIVSQFFRGPPRRLCPYFNKFKNGISNWWQVFYVGGIVLGAYMSATASGSWAIVRGVPPVHAFMGGFLMIFGSRLAGGCTSGHGLSGMGLLSILSFIAVACMFTGGILTAYIMKYFSMIRLTSR